MISGPRWLFRRALNGDKTSRRFSMVRCRWSRKASSPARGCQGATKRHLVDGCRESEISHAWFTGKTGDHGVPRSLEARPGCRWNGQNVPPWFGAGGAGRLQDQRVIDRRYGLLTRSGPTPDTAICRGIQRARASGSPCQDVQVLPHTSCSLHFAADLLCYPLRLNHPSCGTHEGLTQEMDQGFLLDSRMAGKVSSVLSLMGRS